MTTHRRIVLAGLGLVAGAMVVVVCAVHYRGKWAVDRYRRELLAGGEKLTVEDALPPPAMPEDNGAPIFSQALFNWPSANFLEKNSPVAMLLVAPGKAAVGWQQPDVRVDGTNTWDEVETAMAQYQAALDLVREAATRPAFDFRLNYRQGPSLLLPHLAPEKRAVQRLTAAELCDLRRGDTAGAVTNVQTMLALVKATAYERLTISQLVRIAMAHLSVAATWELLQAPVTDTQLAAVQRDWAGLSFVGPFGNALELERALDQMMLERMRNSSAQFRQMVGGGSTPPVFGQTGDHILEDIVASAQQTRWRLALSYPDQLRALKGFQVLLEGFRQVDAGKPFEETFARQREALAALGLQSTNDEFRAISDPSGPDLRSMFSESVVSLSRVLHRVFTAEAARELTVTAIALRRYQLAHGQYPAELSALVPEYLAAVPRDPADGKTLRYRLKPDGTFLLYSVGEDGIDNGGDPSPETPKSDSPGWERDISSRLVPWRGRDLVWPLPATEEEIKAGRSKKR